MPEPEEQEELKPVTPPWWWTRKGFERETIRRTREKFPGASLRRAGQKEPFYKAPPVTKLPESLPSSTWADLFFIDPTYKKVLRFLANPSDPDLYMIALKAQSEEVLSPDEVTIINEAWNILATQQAGLAEKAQEEKWWAAQGLGGMTSEKRQFEIFGGGRERQEAVNRQVEERYQAQRQSAERTAIQTRQKEQQRQIQEMESKREALKGPRDWMRYMTEIGETPSWIKYWFAKR